ncbi:MAG TPA: hypothetical protein VFZ09_36430 [Archangium sp.]|uniref:hypothetical protein n=1 Tax=Archangium sp. TaxID=1872627 RepID=UPI002E3196CB|nr:hypothetical protein [Archangium sp.]HEX5751764.1 hypothetical protein [Archangium sp.]
MADTKRGKVRRLGPFRLGRVHENVDVLEFTRLGPIYEARNERTGAAAVVLVPGPHVGWKPTEDWTVRATCSASSSYVALEVEQGPSRSQLKDLSKLLDLLTLASLRMKYMAPVQRHLTSGARPPKRKAAARRRGWPVVAYGLAVGIATLVLFVGVDSWRAKTGAPKGTQPVAAGVAVQAVVENRAPTLADTIDEGASIIAYPLPGKPFSDQAKAPCEDDEVQINGGCWVELARRPPCSKNQAEYEGKCYLPISARSRKPRQPQSLHP